MTIFLILIRKYLQDLLKIYMMTRKDQQEIFKKISLFKSLYIPIRKSKEEISPVIYE